MPKPNVTRLFLLQAIAFSTLAQSAQFDRVFSPQDGVVCEYEKAARDEICLNGTWLFRGDENTEIPGEQPAAPQSWDKTPIKIPSPWNVNAFVMKERVQGGDFCAYASYPKSWESLQAAWMEKSVTVPKDWNDKRIILHFGAVAGKMVVYVNGRRVGEGFDIFFAQDFDVTKWIRLGDTNQILVKIIAPKVFEKPGSYGRHEYICGSFWGSFIAGIWQDVFLLAEPKVFISDIFVQSYVNRDDLRIETEITNSTSESVTVDLSGDVHEWLNQSGQSVLDAPEVKWKLGYETTLKFPAQKINLAPGESQKIVFTAKVNGHLKLWSPDSPNLYGLVLKLSANGKAIDLKYQRFGWRQFTIEENKFCLNGKLITLRGDSWHFMGVPQMTRRYSYAWYRLLKDAGANSVRLHASVYPSFYHDLADEMGIMILDESGIWLSDGNPKADSDLFWQNCRAHVTELVRRDRNHPSVFGWSICNEILPVLRNVWHAPTNMIDHCFDEMVAWKNICYTNDPTRVWISGDGEEDAGGRLPIINIHYGDDRTMQRASDSGKPWAVGETSMAYYGTPKQVSKFNGNRAYESGLGRMEGLADECYTLLRAQQKYNASYQSVFNIVWYAVQPLPLGKSDLSKPIAADEGIFFPQFREGVPGMQPERLGPYTTTLNPGYDPHLPLYRPWPMFDAIRDANSSRTDSPWANSPAANSKKSSLPAVEPTNTVYFVPENGARLAESFALAGVKALPYSSAVNFLLLDGSFDANASAKPQLKTAVDDVLARGGTVWVWNINSSGAEVLSKWFGVDIQAVPHVASSFILKQDNALLQGFDNASLYFSEDDDWRQMAFGLGGKFLDKASIILEACPADWRKWNYQGEPVKTAALFRSQVEETASRAAIAEFPSNHGRVILCNLESRVNSTRKAEIVAQFFRNEGIQSEKMAARSEFISFNGRLMRALVCGSFPVFGTNNPYLCRMPAGEIKPGAIRGGQKWTLANANKNGVFDFRSGLVNSPTEDAFAYVAVWIKSPKPLNDLLSEPNLPKLSFNYGSDDGCEVWLNGDLLATHDRHGPLGPEMFSQNPLLLKLGWNLLVVKVVQNSGEWQFAGKFGCSDLSFLSKLEFAAQKPDPK